MNLKNKQHVIAVCAATARLRSRLRSEPRPLGSGCAIAGRALFSTAILLLLAGRALAAGATTEIKVDQVGYLTGAPKVALVASKNAASEFTVRRASDGK